MVRFSFFAAIAVAFAWQLKRGSWHRAVRRVVIWSIVALGLVELALHAVTHTLSTWGDWGVNDPVVGRIAYKPNLFLHHPQGFSIRTGEHSTRRNGHTPPTAQHPLTLAVGDSFTFGEEVDDGETWPAILEEVSGHPVINGGMINFGFDQTVLRAEQLAEIYAPDTIVVSFIPEGIRRTQFSHLSGHAKPYFEIGPSGLVLQSPAPPGIALRILASSMAIELLFGDLRARSNTRVHEQGTQVACLLTERLAALGRTRHTRIVVVAQPQAATDPPESLSPPTPPRTHTSEVLACAHASGLPTLDIFTAAIERLPIEGRRRLFNDEGKGHMNADGNHLVATALMRFLGDAAPSPVAP